MSIRIVFLGSPAFAVPSLRALFGDASLDVVLVVTQPDRAAGRGRRLTTPPVALAATELGVDMFQPEALRDDVNVERILDARPDLLVVVAYGELLRRAVLELAPCGALNVHPSLLPRYRGATPIPAAILAGDRVTGTSIIKLVRRLDAGPIIAQRELDITPNDTSATLSVRLAEQAAKLLPAVVIAWVAGNIDAREQDEGLATYCREWTRDDARIDWSAPAAQIERLVRAANPWPLAWTTLDGASVAIHASRFVEQFVVPASTGRVYVSDDLVMVDAADGALELVVVQPAGKRPMPAADWLRGLRRTELTLGS